jgi:membrane fusion protein (multidrug efflux system)
MAGHRARRCLLAAVALALAGCDHEAERRPSRQAQAAPRSVRTAAVERTGGDERTAVPATVHARQRAALSARIPASVVALPWREGDRVAAGAVLVRLDDRALRSELLAADAAAGAAEADRRRMEALLARGAATPREAEESLARAASATAAVAGARDGLAYAVLRAPFAGTVAARRANVGDVVVPGTTLVEIEGLDGLELRATVDAGLVARLHPGLVVPALVDGQADALRATVTAVSAAGDSATHRFEVRADLPATPGLRSGLFARLLVPSPGGAPRLLVPSAAVVPRGGLHGLFVISEGTARLRWVALGATNGTLTEVRAGVEAGERVALDPATLVDGTPVTELPEAR